jgi:maltooligosyltrehalose trehalohydrolase
MGVNAQWCDDLHHALITLLTGDRTGYYEDYNGFSDLVKAYREGYVLDGRYSAYRGRRHGNSARDLPPERFVVCCQNHDQVGNRMLGERLAERVSFEELKLAAAVVLLSPYQPLLFMGEEYGETAPFQYFISHGDAAFVEATRRGRQEEFSRFCWAGEPPDPQDVATFERSKLNHALGRQAKHQVLREFYKTLIALRKAEPALAFADRQRCNVQSLSVPGRLSEPASETVGEWARGGVMTVRRLAAGRDVWCVFHFGGDAQTVELPLGSGWWEKRLDSADVRWQGPGSEFPERLESSGQVTFRLAPHSVVVLAQVSELASWRVGE